MRKRYENKFSMFKAIETFFNDNISIVSTIPELEQHFNSLKSLSSQITSKEEEKRTVLKGKSLRKLSEKNDAIKKAMAISGALYAFAKKTNKIELADNADVFKSDLTKLRDNELMGVLNTLKELAQQHLADIESFGITNAKFSAYSDKIQMYETAVGKREISSSLRSGAVSSLKSLFTLADDLLLTIDRLVNGLNEDYPGFVNDYYMARWIKNMGIRHKNEQPVNLDTPVPSIVL